MKKTLIVAALLTAALAQAQTTDTLKKIKDSGAVTMGVRETSGAMSSTIGNNQFVGFHIDVCNRVLADIQKQLGLAKLDIKMQPVTSQNRIPLVQNGTVDIECGSTTNTAARQKDVAFALTTYVAEVRMATKANSGITSIAQLAGRKVATTTGTTSVQHLRKHEKANNVNFEEVFGKDHADSFLLLDSGRADAFIMDDYILAGNIAKAKNPAEFRIVGETLSIEPIAIMFRKDDPAFKKAVDDSIRAMIKADDLTKILAKHGLTPGADTKAAWANPNDKPAEDYAKK